MTVNENNCDDISLSASLSENLAAIKNCMGDSMDLLVNEIKISGLDCALICCEGMLSTSTITQLILRPLEEIMPSEASPYELKSYINNHLLLSIDRSEATTYGDFFRFLMSGFAMILIDGVSEALALGVQGYDKRGIDEPSGETNVRGSHEGFTEVIRTNISLIRRRMKTPTVRFDMQQMGSRSKTDVCLVYMTDKVSRKMLSEIKKRLSEAELETILTSGYIQPFLEEDKPFLFNSVGTTERPDVLCSKILEGRVCVLVDGTPFALVVPYLFVENFQTLDDYCAKPFYATFIRLIKYIGFLISILLTGLYVGIVTWHPEFFNGKLLMLLAEEEADAPFSLAVEAFVMLILYELIREAGLRLPKAVGGAVSIVGGLIIGDAAVSSGLVSTPLLIIVALSVTASFVIPSLNDSVTLLRLAFLAAGAIAGLYGIALAVMILIFNLTSINNYGIPETAPIAPFIPKSFGDVFTRISFRKMQSRNFDINSYKEKKQ